MIAPLRLDPMGWRLEPDDFAEDYATIHPQYFTPRLLSRRFKLNCQQRRALGLK
jgi:hypothetical protein